MDSCLDDRVTTGRRCTGWTGAAGESGECRGQNELLECEDRAPKGLVGEAKSTTAVCAETDGWRAQTVEGSW